MTPDVGKDIEALCSKCGDVWHVVVAKVGVEVVQVLCKECGARHRYRNPKAPTASAKRAPRTPRAARPAVAPVARIDEPQVAADLSRPPRTYSAAEKFIVGERVEHPSFGQGVVESTADLGKMVVFFATGRRVLVHEKGGGAASSLSRPKPFDHTLPTPGSKPATET